MNENDDQTLEQPGTVETATPAQDASKPAAPTEQKSPWEQKMERLRADLGRDGTPPAGEDGAGDEDDGEELVAAEDDGQPRDERGRFAAKDGESAENAEDEGGVDAAPFVAKLPGRRPEDPDFELPLDRAALEAAGIDPDEALERFTQLRRGYMRRQEVTQERERNVEERRELDSIYDGLQRDPVGFIVENVSPALRADITRELLRSLDDQTFDQILGHVDGWARNPTARQIERTEAENQRLRAESERRRESEERSRSHREVREIGQAIDGLIPEEMDDRKADTFFRVAAIEIQKYAAEKRLTSIDPSDVPQILADIGVLEDFGLSPRDKAGTDAPASSARRSGLAEKKAQAPDVRTRHERRKHAAAVAPAGAGSGAAEGFKRVPGETYESRRNRLARALGLPEKKLG